MTECSLGFGHSLVILVCSLVVFPLIFSFQFGAAHKGVAMHRSGLIVPIVALLGLLAGGCQNKLHDENIALYQQNRELQAKLSDAENRLKAAPDPSQLQSMQQEIAARDAKIADLQNQLRQPAPGQGTDNSLAGIEVTKDERAGTVTVTVPGDVL